MGDYRSARDRQGRINRETYTSRPVAREVEEDHSTLTLTLHALNKRLDHDDCKYAERARLDQKRRTIVRKLAGCDPRHFIDHGAGAIPPHKRDVYEVKRMALELIKLIDGDVIKEVT
jgi:hypothetical protein